jgi:HlyD family secretion protein
MDRRKIIAAVVVVALLVAAFATRGFGLVGNQRDGELSLYGNVDIREVDLAFRVGGRIESISVDEGAKVQAGQPLAALDTTSLDSRIAQADAQVARAQAQLTRTRNGSRRQDVAQASARVAAAQAVAENAERDVRRRQGLVEPGAISRNLWEQTLADRDRAAAQLAEARQALSLLQSGSRAEDVAAAAADLRAAQAAKRGVATDLGDARLAAATS